MQFPAQILSRTHTEQVLLMGRADLCSLQQSTTQLVIIRTLVLLVNSFKKRVAKVNFKRSSRIRDDLHAVEMHNLTTTLNKPITVGYCILELSKVKN